MEEHVIVNKLMNPTCTTHSDSELYLGTSSLDKIYPSHMSECIECTLTPSKAMQWGPRNSLSL